MDNPALAWPRVGLLPVVHAIEAALREKRGFSLIRLGDGEGVLLDHANPAQKEGLAASLACWFGEQVLSTREVEQLCDMLGGAIAGSDVLGLPRPFQVGLSPRYGAVFDHLGAVLKTRTRRGMPLYGDTALHFYLQWSGALARLLCGVEKVTLITCRDVGPALAQTYDIAVRSLLVMGEHCWPGAVDERHWPDGFGRVMAGIEQVGAGELVLVGAGALGKAYCEAVRQRGGVAIDIGSGFDGWAGVMSRPGRIYETPIFAMDWAAGEDVADEALAARLHTVVSATNIPDGTY